MRNKHFLAALCVFLTIRLSPKIDAEVVLSLEANKVKYFRGEPILFRTVFKSKGEPVRFEAPGFGWGREWGFSFLVAKDGGEYFNPMRTKDMFRMMESEDKSKVPLPFWGPPTVCYESGGATPDRHWLPGSLGEGESFERVDMLLFDIGTYSLRTQITDVDGWSCQSNAVSFKVRPIDGKDSITTIADPSTVGRLGSAIFFMHHMEREWGGYGAWPSLDGPAFDELAQKVMQQCKDSVFNEYAAYAYIMTHGDPRLGGRPITDLKLKEIAEQFIKDYPNSWLLPEVYRKLFWTYVAEKDREKAEQAREKALKVAPHATVLRYVREYSIDALE